MKFTLARFCGIFVIAAPLSVFAATPNSGTISPSSTELTFTSGPHFVSNPSNQAEDGGVCGNPSPPCDHFELSVNIPVEWALSHPSARIEFRLAWTGPDDYDVYILNATGGVVTSAASSANPEVTSISAGCGPQSYRVRVIPFAVTGTTASGTITLLPGDEVPLPPGPIDCNTVIEPPPPPPPGASAGPYVPRYRVYSPPAELDGGTGEPSVGYNSETHVAFILSGLRTLWAKFPQDLDPPLPQACEAQWEDRSFVVTGIVSLDPIGLTDSLTRGKESNRTYIGQLGPKAHFMGYTDDDGATWIPTQGSSSGASGVDHQTIGVAPYPAGLEVLAVDPNFPNALYYCAQDIAYGNCARSDNGGVSFNAPVNMYTLVECGGLHGHLRGGPDGTIFVPNSSCGGKPSVVVSEDAGLTWDVRPVAAATESAGRDPQYSATTDPDIGYLCFAAGNNKAFGARTTDKGLTWSTPVELGKEFGLQHTTFLQGIAGDPDRAVCGFVGTATAGNPTSMDFEGVWHLYIATTFDGGQTWKTINATPTDLVQGKGGIWDSGGSNTNRNLLDFNEMTIDERGFAIYGFADGCLGGCETNPANNTWSAFPRIARQLGGRPLYAEFDRVEPYAPPGACLAGTRTEETATLTWTAPENGGATIVNYKVYRGTTSGGEVYLGETGTAKTTYEDSTVNPNVPVYYYTVTAINSAGEGVFSNELPLPIGSGITESPCTPPGVTILVDAEGDALDQVPAHDIRKLSISQPWSDGDYKIFFHLKMADLSQLTDNTIWPINFCSPAFPCVNPDTNTAPYSATNKYYTVEMSTVAPATSVAPVFRIRQPTAAGTTAGSRTVVPALPESGYSVDGLITVAVNASDIGLLPEGAGADQLRAFQTRILVNGGVVNPTPDNMPNSLAGAGEYLTAELELCAPNTPPLASLDADIVEGFTPVTVTFTVFGSDSDGEDLATFSLNFGDGEELNNQSFASQEPVTLTHTYQEPRLYTARLSVTDARGVKSTNVAQQNITVNAITGPARVSLDNNQIGGATSSLSLLVLSLLGVLGLRRKTAKR